MRYGAKEIVNRGISDMKEKHIDTNANLIYIFIFFTEKNFFSKGSDFFRKKIFGRLDGRGHNALRGRVSPVRLFSVRLVWFCSHYKIPPFIIQ